MMESASPKWLRARSTTAAQAGRRRAGVGGIHLRPPFRQLLETHVARAAVVGDVVHRPAKAVDLEDGLAALARQDAHRGVEGAAGGPSGSKASRGFADRH